MQSCVSTYYILQDVMAINCYIHKIMWMLGEQKLKDYAYMLDV